MEKASFILPKLAIFVLLIGIIVPMLGEGQMVIEEVIIESSKPMNVVTTDGCQTIHEKCSGSIGLDCCKGLYCDFPPNSPPGTPGICMAKCAENGQMCSASIGIPCCKGLTCYYPIYPPSQPVITEGICGL